MAEKEYIEREAALAFQNEVEPILCRNVVTHDIMSATKDADMVKYLQSIPAAEVRPVVLCRDCEHYELDNGWCEYFDTDRVFEDYCSEGVKREKS